MLLFLGKFDKILPKPGFSKPNFGHPAGSTKLDRPYCKQFRIWGPLMGHTPSTAGTFRKKFRKDSGKTPETLSERFLQFPSRVRLGCPKPYNSRHLRLAERFQNSLPPSTAGDASFFQKWFRRGPLSTAGHGIPSSTGGTSDLSSLMSETLFFSSPGEFGMSLAQSWLPCKP